ncbi:MAG: hypothetical protein KAJ10_15835, partial [Thermodesulfovibrionia bacterium]|nr:hypothetical protein [Thermodesulfovibrionia bacterium]
IRQTTICYVFRGDGLLVSLPHDPGIIHSKQALCHGETIAIKVEGLPPYKDIPRPIRNINHPSYDSFVALRKK